MDELTDNKIEHQVLPNLEELSTINLENWKNGFISKTVELGFYDSPEKARLAIEAEKEIVLKQHGLTINLTAASIARLMETGNQHTFWDHLAEATSLEHMQGAATTQKKSLTSMYAEFRRTAENALRKFVPKKDNSTENPVYAAVVGGDNRDFVEGACHEYGNYFLSLTDLPQTSIVYNFLDSMACVGESEGQMSFDSSFLLASKDVPEAKAMVNLARRYNQRFGRVGNLVSSEFVDKLVTINDHRSGYVEAAIFAPIGLDNVTQIGVLISEQKQIFDLSTLLRTYPQIETKINIYLNANTVGPLTKKYLLLNYPGKVNFLEERNSLEDLGTSYEIESLDFEEVTTLLTKKSDEIKKKLMRKFVMDRWTTVSLSTYNELRRQIATGKFRDPEIIDTVNELRDVALDLLFFKPEK